MILGFSPKDPIVFTLYSNQGKEVILPNELNFGDFQGSGKSAYGLLVQN
jgi:hypothetical protein